jgi:TolB protein
VFPIFRSTAAKPVKPMTARSIMNTHQAMACCLAMLAAVSGCGGSQAPAANAWVSFTRFDPLGSNIFTVETDGTGEQQITFGTAVDAHGTWDSTGEQLAYSRVTPGGSSIQLARVGTAEHTALTPEDAWGMVPSFSPDASRIAFTSARDGNFEIYTIARDGTDLQQLTFSEHPTTHVGPKYAPDGQTIVYAKRLSDQDPDQDLYLMRADGAHIRRLTQGANNAESRSWSPDGKRIVFNNVVAGVGQIFVVNVDGSGYAQLTRNRGTTPAFEPGGIFPGLRGDITPAWSPDGAWIAYASDADGDFDIYLIRPDGREKRQITNTAGQELSVGWRPKN